MQITSSSPTPPPPPKKKSALGLILLLEDNLNNWSLKHVLKLADHRGGWEDIDDSYLRGIISLHRWINFHDNRVCSVHVSSWKYIAKDNSVNFMYTWKRRPRQQTWIPFLGLLLKVINRQVPTFPRRILARCVDRPINPLKTTQFKTKWREYEMLLKSSYTFWFLNDVSQHGLSWMQGQYMECTSLTLVSSRYSLEQYDWLLSN